MKAELQHQNKNKTCEDKNIINTWVDKNIKLSESEEERKGNK